MATNSLPEWVCPRHKTSKAGRGPRPVAWQASGFTFIQEQGLANMTEQSIQTAAHKMVYILVVEQSLRAGEGMSEQALAPTCKAWHRRRRAPVRAGLGRLQGWLQKAGDEVRLTEAGFDMNFTQ
jgi:hypothetical protein